MAKLRAPKTPVNINDESWVRWFSEASDRSTNIFTIDQYLAPISINANSTHHLSGTVKGVVNGDIILSVTTKVYTFGITINMPLVTGDNVVNIVYGNLTGGAIVPAAQIYTFYIIRP